MNEHSESLYESTELPKPTRDAAALLASKVYYYLGDYGEALSFALNAGNAFADEGRTPGAEEYVETVICAYISMDMLEDGQVLSIVQRERSTVMLSHARRSRRAKTRLTPSSPR